MLFAVVFNLSAPGWAKAQEREFTDLDLRIRVGAGMDSNVFRSPSDPYVDLSIVGQPLITPVVSTGFYIPVSVSAKYQVNSLEKEGFFGSYRLGGRFYQDKNLTNGERSGPRLSTSGERCMTRALQF